MSGLKVIDCDKANDLLRLITPWSSDYNISDYVFRGHSNDNYELLSNSFRDKTHADLLSIARIMVNEKFKYATQMKLLGFGNLASQHAAMEYHVLRRFYKKSNEYGLYVPRSKFMSQSMEKSYVNFEALMRLYNYDVWPDRDHLEIASIAQHYGLPTRLIDWSYNPYTAAFFASNFRYNNDGGNLSLWMMNVKMLSDVFDMKTSDIKMYNPHYQWNDNAKSQLGIFTYKVTDISKETIKLQNELYAEIATENKIPKSDVYSKLYCDYETLDQSVVRLVNEFNAKREEKIKIDDAFLKITLPRSEAAKLNSYLRKINISEGTIYPGYAGVASELKSFHSIG